MTSEIAPQFEFRFRLPKGTHLRSHGGTGVVLLNDTDVESGFTEEQVTTPSDIYFARVREERLAASRMAESLAGA